MKKRRLEIVVETERRVTLRRRGALPSSPCGQCLGSLVLVEEAVAVTGLSSRTIHRLVEAGEVHFMETNAGALLVCPDSLGSGAVEADEEPPLGEG